MNAPTWTRVIEPALTRREVFAAMAMQGMIANPATSSTTTNEALASYARHAADALIAELDKEVE